MPAFELKRQDIGELTVKLLQIMTGLEAAKLHAALSLLIWMGVIACGRLLAYI
jgi:hypothetical protein